MVPLRWAPPRDEFRTARGGTRKAGYAPMSIVWSCDLDVQHYAALGKTIEVPRPCCPSCAVWMTFWSGYLRPVRCDAKVVASIWVRRARCPHCLRSDALLPSFLLYRRLDTVEVIGKVITSLGEGSGARSCARSLGIHRSTVRSWWSRHHERVQLAVALMMLLSLEPPRCLVEHRPDEVLAALGLPASAPLPAKAWREVSLRSDGLWLVPCHHHRLVPSRRRKEGV
jgi:hypothetical protein